MRANTKEHKGDWKPLVFILTDGYPTDTDVFNREVQNISTLKTASIIALAAGSHAGTSYLKMITNNVLLMNNLNVGDMAKFFSWVTDSIGSVAKSLDMNHGIPVNETLPQDQTMPLTMPTPPACFTVVP